MKNLFLFLSTLLFVIFYHQSYAAYPVQAQSTAEVLTVAPVFRSGFHEKVKTAIHRLTTPSPAEQRGATGDGTIGLVSFGLGAGGLVLLLASGAVPFLGLLGIACGIGAIVTGAMGFKQRNKGWAIAGFALGVLEVLFLILVIVAIAALIGGL